MSHDDGWAANRLDSSWSARSENPSETSVSIVQSFLRSERGSEGARPLQEIVEKLGHVEPPCTPSPGRPLLMQGHSRGVILLPYFLK